MTTLYELVTPPVKVDVLALRASMRRTAQEYQALLVAWITQLSKGRGAAWSGSGDLAFALESVIEWLATEGGAPLDIATWDAVMDTASAACMQAYHSLPDVAALDAAITNWYRSTQEDVR